MNLRELDLGGKGHGLFIWGKTGQWEIQRQDSETPGDLHASNPAATGMPGNSGENHLIPRVPQFPHLQSDRVDLDQLQGPQSLDEKRANFPRALKKKKKKTQLICHICHFSQKHYCCLLMHCEIKSQK